MTSLRSARSLLLWNLLVLVGAPCVRAEEIVGMGRSNQPVSIEDLVEEVEEGVAPAALKQVSPNQARMPSLPQEGELRRIPTDTAPRTRAMESRGTVPPAPVRVPADPAPPGRAEADLVPEPGVMPPYPDRPPVLGTNRQVYGLQSGQPIQGFAVIPQVSATPIPTDADGLVGNRQVSLTPFPNLYMASGPLTEQQLPWYHKRPSDQPYSLWRTLKFQTAFSAAESNGREDGNPGNYNSFSGAIPFWAEREVGVQAGIVVEPTTYPTIFGMATLGAFHHAIWQNDDAWLDRWWNRVSWGSGYDGMYDSELRTFIGQWRSQASFALDPNRECGFWVTFPLHDDPAEQGASIPLLVDAAASMAFFYRHAFPSEVDMTLFAGHSENPGGAFVGSYWSYRFAQQASFTFQGMTHFNKQGAWAILMGIEVHFVPLTTYTLISGNPENRYMPYLRTADHINLQVRKRPL